MVATAQTIKKKGKTQEHEIVILNDFEILILNYVIENGKVRIDDKK